MRKTALLLLIVLSLTGLIGCGKEKPEKVYASVLSSLTEDQSYAYVTMNDEQLPLLLVTDATYSYDDGIQAALICDVYYAWDGTVQNLGSIESEGTAYPIRCGRDGIVTAGNHFVARYMPDKDKKELTAVEYANESFDEAANAAYTYYDQKDGEQSVPDSSKMDTMFKQYQNLPAVDFGR